MEGYCWLRKISIPRQWDQISLESNVMLDDGVVLLCSGDKVKNKILIQCGVYINRYTMIDAHRSIVIQKNAMIGPFCYITDGDHGKAKDIEIRKQPMITAPVIIEEDTWIGAHTTILKGVIIGKGAIIGAGSVVTKSIPANSIAVGTPAKVINRRE
jgi:acetyltransferase-like isoleucine patch superfamily enzyme